MLSDCELKSSPKRDVNPWGLNENKTHCDMKKNWSQGLLLVILLGSFVMIFANCQKDEPKKDEPDYGTLVDIDGNVYKTVEIGTQVWMAENLKTTRFNDYAPILLEMDASRWFELVSPAYCWYDNDPLSYTDVYGALYNWHTVSTGKLCPDGWRVPTEADWAILIDYLGGESVAGGKLKSTGTAHWLDPNTGATNETGFAALPGGRRSTGGTFNVLGKEGNWWTSSGHSTYNSSWYRRLSHASAQITQHHVGRYFGFSVRCVEGEPIIDPGYDSVEDADGNSYKTVQIGSQLWMAENLKTTSYNDGRPIPIETEGENWATLKTPAYCWFDNDPASYADTYGALYNWYAVNTGELCPDGWRVPTAEDWEILISYLGGENVAGGKLKEAGTTHWLEPNTGATNETGFTALPGGRRSTGGTFSVLRHEGYWWTSTEHETYLSSAWNRRMSYSSTKAQQHNLGKTHGFSVRCVKDVR
jgi:uncharacterized protein (TIGR02145 family)